MNNTEIKQDFSPAAERSRIGGIWEKSYTWVLLSNAGYILVFYILMKIFN